MKILIKLLQKAKYQDRSVGWCDRVFGRDVAVPCFDDRALVS
jgi:hypothetical protein